MCPRILFRDHLDIESASRYREVKKAEKKPRKRGVKVESETVCIQNSRVRVGLR